MNCTDYQLLIDDLVDGTLDASARQDLESHLSRCEECRRVAADVRAIRDAAGTLDVRVPAPQVWQRITTAIAEDRHRPAWQRVFGLRSFGWSQLAAATVAVALIATVGWMAWRDLGVPSAGNTVAVADTSATEPDAIQPASVTYRLAADQYVKEIEGLEQITKTGMNDLDAGTADVVTANLDVVNKAIGESRAALDAEPESEVAQESLFQAFRSKVELLQDAIALINEMRQGNQEGAARIVSGQNQ